MLLVLTRLDNSDDVEFIQNIHHQYNRLIFSKARKYLTDAREIEDVMQDCWEKLVRHVDTIKPLEQKALVAYIIATVRNTAYNYNSYQKVRNRYASLAEVDEVYFTEFMPSPEDQVLRKEFSKRFRERFSLLSEDDQRLLECKLYLEWSDAEAAKLFHCRPASMRMKLSRAKQRARALLQEGDPIDGQT